MKTHQFTSQQLEAIANLRQAQDKLLEAFGWIRIKERHWTPSVRIGCAFPDDCFFQISAMRETIDYINAVSDLLRK